jgi:glutamate/aspartate transport system substrate-binding protein
LFFAIGAMSAAVAVEPALAQPADRVRDPHTGTLKRINDGGEIRIGYRENSPPFAFLDARRKPLGYSARPVRKRGGGIAAELDATFR